MSCVQLPRKPIAKLQQRNDDACQQLGNEPGEFEIIRNSMVRRVQYIIQM